MRQHNLETGFDERIRGLVRNAPWWMTSLVIHAVAAVILAAIPFSTARAEPMVALEATAPDAIEPIDDEEPPAVDKLPIEEPTDVADVQEITPTEDTDDISDETFGDVGDASGPFSGPSDGTAIGLGGPAGGGRGKGGRRTQRGSVRGSRKEQIAVDWGLKWLADHQDVGSDGKWDADDFMKHDPPEDKCDGSGGQLYDVGLTGLSLLAFLGAGYTDRGSKRENKYAKNVRKGLRYLMQSQAEDGVFGTRATHSFMYNHAIATLAMCEAFWMTGNPRYKKPAQEGLNFLAMARNPYMAWRYEPRGGENDTSVTAWCVMALKSGKFANLEVDPSAFDGARQWIDKMTDPNFGQVGYNFPGGSSSRPEGKQDRFPAEKSQSMTAAGILTRIFLGEDPRKSEMIKKGAKLCLGLTPTWNPDDGSIDMYYWYYATLALYQVGGKSWKTWNEAMKTAIVDNQHAQGSGTREGSWDPIGCWGDDGGRIYSTATMVMCLEIYYRYDRVFGAR